MSPVKAPEETRARILKVAFNEFYRNGFQAGSLNRIVEAATTTKGGLFHHFKGKKELGYAVVDEIHFGYVEERWIKPLGASDDPILTIQKIMANYKCEAESGDYHSIVDGCPLNNIAQEMAALDEGFRTRIERIFRAWRQALADALSHGQETGHVKKDLNTEHAAAFIVASLEGMVGAIKNSRSLELMDQLGKGFMQYLETLRS